MTTLNNTYKGELRTEAIHTKSGTRIITDAPTDNHGKGAAFSPTDLLCAALSSCMLTVMGIEAQKMDLNFEGMKTEVFKTMTASPRKISKIKIVMHHPALQATQEQKDHLKDIALNCPVALSLSDILEQDVEFNF